MATRPHHPTADDLTPELKQALAAARAVTRRLIQAPKPRDEVALGFALEAVELLGGLYRRLVPDVFGREAGGRP